MKTVVWVFPILCLILLMVPATVGTAEFVRRYEATSAYGYGDPATDGGYHSAYVCRGGQDLAVDTGGCVAYRTPGYDHVGKAFTVTIDDTVFGRTGWAIVTVDVNGDDRVSCDVDACFSGQGVIYGNVPAHATGGFLRVHPATVYTDGFGCCPAGFAAHGVIRIVFTA